MQERLLALALSLLLSVLGSAAMPAYGQETAKTPEAAVENEIQLAPWWHEQSVDKKRETLKREISSKIVMLPEAEMATLLQLSKKYPFEGIGIGYEGTAEVTGPDTWRVGSRVTSVVKISPAAQAGIRPGDWIINVNGAEICFMDLSTQGLDDTKFGEAQRAVDACTESGSSAVAPAVKDASGKILVLVTRGNESLGLTVSGKATLGSEVASFIAARHVQWESDLTNVKTKLMELAITIETAPEDANFDAYARTYVALSWKIDEPRGELRTYVDSLTLVE